MYAIKRYKDLKTELELTKDRMDMLQEEREVYIKLMKKGCPGELSGQAYSDMPKGSRNDMSLDRIVNEISKIDSMLYIESERLRVIERYEKEISSKLKKLEGLEYKVMYMKEIEGLSNQEIANKLGYSYQTIANMMCEIKKREQN